MPEPVTLAAYIAVPGRLSLGLVRWRSAGGGMRTHIGAYVSPNIHKLRSLQPWSDGSRRSGCWATCKRVTAAAAAAEASLDSLPAVLAARHSAPGVTARLEAQRAWSARRCRMSPRAWRPGVRRLPAPCAWDAPAHRPRASAPCRRRVRARMRCACAHRPRLHPSLWGACRRARSRLARSPTGVG